MTDTADRWLNHVQPLHRSTAGTITRTDAQGFSLSIVLLLLALLATLSGCATMPDTHPGATRPDSKASSVTAKREPEVDIDRASLPDLWARMRVGFALPELDTPDVERFAERFAATNWLEKLGPRARRYLYLLVTEAEDRNVPTELALLPIIESGLNPQAQSAASAVGLCQFIPTTARRFGLQHSALADRRKDVACIDSMYDYLARNAKLFNGDWLLALAGYNWGEGAVGRAIERNVRDGQPGDYLSLRMPQETRSYVPQLLALKKLILDPERYGIRLPPVANLPTIDCDVAIPQDMDVTVAARLAGISEAEFRQLNAGVSRGIIPKATHPTICLPFESAVRFIVNVTEHKGKLASLTTHTVVSRTTIAALAKRYHTTPEAIRAANAIAPGMRLKPGATVLVPKTAGESDIPANIAATAQTLVEPDVPDTRKIVVRSKRHDTLAIVAKRHRVDAASVARWNPALKDPLKAGEKVVLHVPTVAKTEKSKDSKPVSKASATRSKDGVKRTTVTNN